jgi:hypothetical protein
LRTPSLRSSGPWLDYQPELTATYLLKEINLELEIISFSAPRALASGFGKYCLAAAQDTQDRSCQADGLAYIGLWSRREDRNVSNLPPSEVTRRYLIPQLSDEMADG